MCEPRIHPLLAAARQIPFALLLLSCIRAVAANQDAAPDPMQLLKLADLARGGGLSGIVWTVQVRNSDADEEIQEMTLRVKAAGLSSTAETLAPIRSKGSKMLQVGRAMWLTKPGLKKPIPISPRQRLTGQAAIGDIAATHYAQDYAATLLRDDWIDDERCHVLELKAIDQRTTYDRVHYWVSQARGTAMRAEFLSLTGKRLKVAEFRYDNVVVHDGNSIPFVSIMTISDDLTQARSTLRYSDIRVRRIPDAEFNVEHLD